METLPVIVPGALFSMKIDIPIIRSNIIRELLYSHKELPRYQHALEILFCVVNGYEPIDGYISGIEDVGYRELYTKILEKVKELRAGLPSANNTSK